MQLFQREAGQKAEATYVDWQDGNAARCGETSGSEHSAVAAKYEKKLRCVCDVLASLTFRSVRERIRRFLVEESAYAARFQPFQQRRNDNGEIRAARAGNDANGLKGLTGVHVRLRFYS